MRREAPEARLWTDGLYQVGRLQGSLPHHDYPAPLQQPAAHSTLRTLAFAEDRGRAPRLRYLNLKIEESNDTPFV